MARECYGFKIGECKECGSKNICSEYAGYQKGRKDALKELEEKMYHESFEVDSDMQKWDSGFWIRYRLFENVLSEVE